jgi:hypothetical protein
METDMDMDMDTKMDKGTDMKADVDTDMEMDKDKDTDTDIGFPPKGNILPKLNFAKQNGKIKIYFCEITPKQNDKIFILLKLCQNS